MAIEGFRFIPQSVADWDRFFRGVPIRPDPNSVGEPELQNSSVTESKVDAAAISTTKIQAHAVTNAKLAIGPAASVVCNPTNAVGDRDDLAFNADGKFLVRRGGVLVADTIADGDIPSGVARDTEVSAAIVAHEAAGDPHPVYATAAEVSAAITAALASILWRTVKKGTTETIASDSTLSNDADLKFTMAANTTYAFRMQVFFSTSAAADFKWRHSGPAAPTAVSITRRNIIAGGTSISQIAEDTAYSAADVALLASAGLGIVWIEGIITNGANAGDFNFQWSQNTLDASNTSVLAGSYLEWMLVA